MKKKKVLITGINGQDGSFLAKDLIERNFKVYGATRRSANVKTERLKKLNIIDKIEFVSLEVTELANVINSLKIIKPDFIYNLAGQSFVADSFLHPHYTSSVNYLGVLNLLEAIRLLKLDVRFYQASTSEMYGDVLESIQDENTPFNPMSPYAISKTAAHFLVKNYRIAYNINASSGILYNHESEFRGQEFVTRKISYLLSKIKKGNGKPIPLGSLDSKRDWGYAPEFVKAMQLINESDIPDDYVVATNTINSVRQFLKWCCEELNLDVIFEGKKEKEICINKKTGNIIAYVDKKFFRPSDVVSLQGSFKKINKKLKWKPKIFAKEIAKIMVNYDLNN